MALKIYSAHFDVCMKIYNITKCKFSLENLINPNQEIFVSLKRTVFFINILSTWTTASLCHSVIHCNEQNGHNLHTRLF